MKQSNSLALTAVKALLGVVVATVWLSSPSEVWAGSCARPASGVGVSLVSYPVTQSHTIELDLSQNYNLDDNYKLAVKDNKVAVSYSAETPSFHLGTNVTNKCNSEGCVSVNDGVVTWKITQPNALKRSGGTGNEDFYYVQLMYGLNQCDVGEYGITSDLAPGAGCTIQQVYQNGANGQCFQNPQLNACFANNTAIVVDVEGLQTSLNEPFNGRTGLRITQEGGGGETNSGTVTAADGKASYSFIPSVGSPEGGRRLNIFVQSREGANVDFPNCQLTVDVYAGCTADQCQTSPSVITRPGTPHQFTGPDDYKFCEQINDPIQQAKCEVCAGGNGAGGYRGVWTAIGCIRRDPEVIAGKLIAIGLSTGGGVSILMSLAAGFILSTSQGDPKRTGEAKEMLTAAVIGLLFIIFSVTILQFIGYTVLKIPGFGGP